MDTKRLRQRVLDLAIHGKLVPQNPQDEPASELLKRIAEEKERLVKEGKIKKSKKKDNEDLDEVPFEVPQGWVWCRLGDIACFFNGDRSKNYPNKEEYVSNGIAWINTGHILPNGYLSEANMNYITENKYNSLSSGKIQKGDLVYCLRGATYGKISRVEPFSKGAVASSLMIIRAINIELKEYIYYYLKSHFSKEILLSYANGAAQPNLAANDVAKFTFPLPPLAEQHRIVSEVEKYFSLIDILEESENDLQQSIQKAKSKILDLAIKGKLVEQNEEDESASVLLERIKKEKNKKEKKGKIKNTGKPDEVPFEVPQGWVWTNIGDLLINRDSERKPISQAIRNKQSNKIYDYYGATGVVDKVDSYIFNERLLLIGEDGANLLSRSKNNAFFAEGKYWVNNHSHVLDCHNKRILDYVALIVNSISLEKYVTGSAQPKLNQDNLNKIPIPLPPLAEQQRIVAKIEELFTQLDNIAEALK